MFPYAPMAKRANLRRTMLRAQAVARLSGPRSRGRLALAAATPVQRRAVAAWLGAVGAPYGRNAAIRNALLRRP
jgi:hypothetical protein